MPRLFTILVMLLFGTLFSQAPEFQQQYRQRLGGALDEINREIARFDADARAVGVTPAEAIRRLAGNPDELARRRADAEIALVARRDNLMRQQEVFATENVFTRLSTLATTYDPEIALGTWSTFRPAIPTTIDGAAAGLLGAGIGLFLVIFSSLGARTVRHFRSGGRRARGANPFV